MGEILHDDAVLDDRRVKTRSLIFKLDIDSSDAPESHNITGVPLDVVFTRNEGDTATADAIECPACWANGYVACVADASGETGFLIDVSALEAGQVVDEVLGVKLLRGDHSIFNCGAVDTQDLIALLGEDVDVSGVVSASGVTLGGNIAFELVNAGIDFTGTDYTQVFEVIYTLR